MTEAGQEPLGVAEAKARFSELIDRVAAGERIVISRRGKVAVALVPPDTVAARPRPAGLLAAVGGLGDWKELDDVVEEIYRARPPGRDRAVPGLG
jgi:prevent-host-death family protein